MAGVKLNQTTETSVMLLGIHIQSNLRANILSGIKTSGQVIKLRKTEICLDKEEPTNDCRRGL